LEQVAAELARMGQVSAIRGAVVEVLRWVSIPSPLAQVTRSQSVPQVQQEHQVTVARVELRRSVRCFPQQVELAVLQAGPPEQLLAELAELVLVEQSITQLAVQAVQWFPQRQVLLELVAVQVVALLEQVVQVVQSRALVQH